MSEQIEKPNISLQSNETNLDQNSEDIATPLGNLRNGGIVSKTNLNESHSPKVTPETFNEQSKAKFKDAFFSGTYEDRVYVESLGSYRDRVIVDEDEIRFIKSLRSVLKRGKKFQGDQFQGIKSKFIRLVCSIHNISRPFYSAQTRVGIILVY